jgi:hypothetical protein
MLTLLSGVFGGLLRLMPELFKFLDAKNDRKHELDMQDKAFAFEKLRADNQLTAIQEQGRAEWATGSLSVLGKAIDAQNRPSGVKWIDGFSSLVRPLITFQWVVLLYPGVIVATFWISVSRGMDVLVAMHNAFGEPEKAVCAFILDFWFIGRILDRGRTGK